LRTGHHLRRIRPADLGSESRRKASVSAAGVRAFCVALAAGDLSGNGQDELVVIDRRMKMAVYAIKSSGLELQYEQWLKSGMANWENGEGTFHALSVRCADLNGDGKDEIILGESLWSRMPVMV
jgi:hypothetical protein